jgi:hypothetical protein
MSTVQLSSVAGAGWQFFDNNGVPLAGGKLYSYEAGTTTPKVTYTSVAGNVANANPIVLDSAGRLPSELWVIANERYKFILTTSTDVQLWSVDNIPGILDNASVSADIVSFVGFKGQIGTVEDLADDDGSDWIGFEQSGVGLTARSVQDKLRDIASRADFVDDAAFIAGKGDKPNIDGNDNFDAKVTPEGEGQQIDLSAAARPAGGMNRGRVNYFSSDAVEVIVPEDIVMGGFRFMGQYKKGRAPVMKSGVPYRAIVNFANDLGAESAANPDNWYAVFACSNDGDTTVTYKMMPFLRVGSVVGSTATLCSVAENTYTVLPVSYSWSAGNNTLADVDCLVINEGADNRFSGRVAKITANTATTATLDTIGQVGTFDYLLPAPPGVDHYCYLCTFYLEVSPGSPLGVEARNIADGGVIVMARNGNTTDPNWVQNGAVAGPPGNKLTWASQISPLATGVYFSPIVSASTSSGGIIETQFSHDGSNHTVARITFYKSTESAAVTQATNVFVSFSIGQFMYYWVDGALAPQRIVSELLNLGWIEP